eukprot:scaffold165842_cov21-Tisochrysis_lutea.AAC.1
MAAECTQLSRGSCSRQASQVRGLCWDMPELVCCIPSVTHVRRNFAAEGSEAFTQLTYLAQLLESADPEFFNKLAQ